MATPQEKAQMCMCLCVYVFMCFNVFIETKSDVQTQ